MMELVLPEPGVVLSIGVSVLLTVLWLVALVQVWRTPDEAFGSPRERAALLVLMVVLGWATSLVWFGWYRRQLRDELNRRSLIDL